MKRITLFSVAAVLLLTGTASAGLMVYEYVPGEKVTLDTATGKYWYWNLQDFQLMTYAQQIAAIGGISPTYGGIAGGWHMASLSEMQALWTNSGTNIMSAFGSATGDDWVELSVSRYDSIVSVNRRFLAGWWSNKLGPYWTPLETHSIDDSSGILGFGAWATTDATVVPAPPAVVMATTGLLCLMGAKLRCRWRRR